MNHQLWLLQPSSIPAPSAITAYLIQAGWAHVDSNERWARYARTIDGDEITIEVPLRETAGDYGRAVSLLLNDLSRLEKRESSVVARDIASSTVDIVRLRIAGSETSDGRIAVEAGRRVYDAARDLLLAAACSTLSPRAAFSKRKAGEAMALLSHARFGQTEVGSFVLTMECAVPPQFGQMSLPLEEPGADTDVFERRTWTKLATALSAAQAAAREAGASNSADPFRSRTQEGVSANLCDALAEILDASKAETLQATFSFASHRPVLPTVPRAAEFGFDATNILREGGRILRSEAPYREIDILGSIVELVSSDPSKGGDAVLQAMVETQIRKIHVKLDAVDYQLALNAHGQRELVQASGDLSREGASWVMNQPDSFGLASRG